MKEGSCSRPSQSKESRRICSCFRVELAWFAPGCFACVGGGPFQLPPQKGRAQGRMGMMTTEAFMSWELAENRAHIYNQRQPSGAR